ncbi:MAG: DUF3179 domain-containing (seleno)protein [Planctomycetales bacterium]
MIAPDFAAGLTPGEGGDDRLSGGRRSAPLQFDLSNAEISIEQILPVGPPKDGIPALTNPQFENAASVGWLAADDRVIGMAIGDEARAYPLMILDQHEIVNDVFGTIPVAITYCPLCDSAVVFDRRVDGEILELGVSGLLYNSNVLMFPVEPLDDRLPPKTTVIAVWTEDSQRVFPVSAVVTAATDGVLRIDLAGLEVELTVDSESQTVHVSSSEVGVNLAFSFWFAWAAFHPKADLFLPGGTDQ